MLGLLEDLETSGIVIVLILSSAEEYRESSDMLLESGEEEVKVHTLGDGGGEGVTHLLVVGGFRYNL